MKLLKKEKQYQLFDLSKDRGERKDLAAQKPELLAKLKAWMDAAWEDPRSQKDDGKYTGK